jgi:hypothetical protein
MKPAKAPNPVRAAIRKRLNWSMTHRPRRSAGEGRPVTSPPSTLLDHCAAERGLGSAEE